MIRAYNAMTFAMEVHKNQVRKYTGEPYWKHLAEVAGIVATVTESSTAISVAWLHDIIEDQDVTYTELKRLFGFQIADGVRYLTDTTSGNRAVRKLLARKRLSEAPPLVQTIKCADIISNASSIAIHDPKFAEVYLQEKREMLAVLTEADPRLRAIALDTVNPFLEAMRAKRESGVEQ